MKKLVLSLALLATSSAAFAMGQKPVSYPQEPDYSKYDGSGVCTREYDPVPFHTKDGKWTTAPNPCVGARWKAEGR